MTNLYFPIFDKNFCARVDKKDKNLIRRPLLTREKPLEKIGERCRGFGKIHYEKMHFGQNKMKKRHLGQNTMEKGVEVSAKDITQKCIVFKIQWKKTDSG